MTSAYSTMASIWLVTAVMVSLLTVVAATSNQCPEGATLTKTSGVIMSPLYPRNYPANQTCSWHIIAPKGNYVKLEIHSPVNIHSCGANCTCDYLQIQNGFSDDPNENGRICGVSGVSKIFYSTHESLEVLFVSDGSKPYRYDGFNATYTHLNHTPPICPPKATPLTGSGNLSSPNYPMSNYPAFRDCSWIITAEPSDKLVKLVFTELALGSCEFNCSSDNCTYVELYDGSSANSSSLGRFCNNSALQEVNSTGNQMFVKFHSGSSLDQGFEAQYSVFSATTTFPTSATTPSEPSLETQYSVFSATTTSPTSATTPSEPSPTKSTSPSVPVTVGPVVVGAVVGAVMGAVLLVVAVITVCCYCKRKRKRKTSKSVTVTRGNDNPAYGSDGNSGDETRL